MRVLSKSREDHEEQSAERPRHGLQKALLMVAKAAGWLSARICTQREEPGVTRACCTQDTGYNQLTMSQKRQPRSMVARQDGHVGAEAGCWASSRSGVAAAAWATEESSS